MDFVLYHLYRKEGSIITPCSGQLQVNSREEIYPALEERHGLKIYKQKTFLDETPENCIIIIKLSGVVNGEVIEEIIRNDFF